MRAEFERIISTGHPARVISAVKEEIADLPTWLSKQASKRELTTLLAFLDDGVVWGKYETGIPWVTSDQAQPGLPALRLKTLQELHLFGPQAELLLFRKTEGEYWLRIIEENIGQPDFLESFDELQFLWGDNAQPAKKGFTLLSEGAQGLCHAIPCEITRKDGQDQLPRLRVRHYLNPDSEPLARVVVSRCVGLEVEKKER